MSWRATAGSARFAADEGGAVTTVSPSASQAATRYGPANPEAPVMKTRTDRPDDRGGVEGMSA